MILYIHHSSVPQCLFRLRIYINNQHDRWGDTVLSSVSTTARLLLYVSPIVIPWAINRGWASPDGVVWMSKVT